MAETLLALLVAAVPAWAFLYWEKQQAEAEHQRSTSERWLPLSPYLPLRQYTANPALQGAELRGSMPYYHYCGPRNLMQCKIVDDAGRILTTNLKHLAL
jgi:hypothetical protein